MSMDARELTKKVIDQENRIFKLERQVDFLTQEYEKQRLLMDDLRIEVQMMQRRPQ